MDYRVGELAEDEFDALTSFRLGTARKPDGSWALDVLGVGEWANVYAASARGVGPPRVALKIPRQDQRTRTHGADPLGEEWALHRLAGHPHVVASFGAIDLDVPLALDTGNGDVLRLMAPGPQSLRFAHSVEGAVRCTERVYNLLDSGDREMVLRATAPGRRLSVPFHSPVRALILEALGMNLEQWCHDNPRPVSGDLPTRLRDVRFRLRMMLQVAEAIEYAHSQGVIHLDVNPENVVFHPHSPLTPTAAGDAMPWVKLIDFDVAESPTEDQRVPCPARSPRSGHGYTAPEIAEPTLHLFHGQLDPSTGVFEVRDEDDRDGLAAGDQLIDGNNNRWRLVRPTADRPNLWIIEPIHGADAGDEARPLEIDGPWDVARHAGPAADIYSLGAVLYMTVSGHHPGARGTLWVASRAVECAVPGPWLDVTVPGWVAETLEPGLYRQLAEPLAWCGDLAPALLGLCLQATARRPSVAFCGGRSDPAAATAARRFAASLRVILGQVDERIRAAERGPNAPDRRAAAAGTGAWPWALAAAAVALIVGLIAGYFGRLAEAPAGHQAGPSAVAVTPAVPPAPVQPPAAGPQPRAVRLPGADLRPPVAPATSPARVASVPGAPTRGRVTPGAPVPAGAPLDRPARRPVVVAAPTATPVTPRGAHAVAARRPAGAPEATETPRAPPAGTSADEGPGRPVAVMGAPAARAPEQTPAERRAAEAARKRAEADRLRAERAAVVAERKKAAADREKAAAALKKAEADRKAAEVARKKAEAAKAKAEAAKAKAEAAKAKAAAAKAKTAAAKAKTVAAKTAAAKKKAEAAKRKAKVARAKAAAGGNTPVRNPKKSKVAATPKADPKGARVDDRTARRAMAIRAVQSAQRALSRGDAAAAIQYLNQARQLDAAVGASAEPLLRRARQLKSP